MSDLSDRIREAIELAIPDDLPDWRERYTDKAVTNVMALLVVDETAKLATPALPDAVAMDLWWTACDDAWAVPEYLPAKFFQLALDHLSMAKAVAS